MKLADALRMLIRRWYIVVPGIILAIAGTVAAWIVIEPEYERHGVQIVLPGTGTLPEGATNPFIYLGGLALPTDIVIQAVSGQNVMDDVLEDYPGTTIEVTRDSLSAPIITITVTAPSDQAAADALAEMLEETGRALESLQTEEGIEQRDRLSLVTLSVDTTSTPVQRTRLLLVGAVAIGILALSLLLAALVDGLAARRRRGGESVTPRSDRWRKRVVKTRRESAPGSQSDQDHDDSTVVDDEDLARRVKGSSLHDADE